MVPKYLDTPQEKEIYMISFDRVGINTRYYILGGTYPPLVTEGETYQFSINIPKEGQSNTFSQIPITMEVYTNQFGKITRITNPLDFMENNNT